MYVAGVVYPARGHHSVVNPWNFGTRRPSSTHGLNFTNWTFFGLAILALQGVEVPLNMGVEVIRPKAMSHVNRHRVPGIAVWVQTAIYDVLQAAITVIWCISIIGGIASLVGIIATLSGSWTPLISNSTGPVTIAGATIAYRTWLWRVAGIAVASFAVAVLLYLIGRRSAAQPEPVLAGAPGARV